LTGKFLSNYDSFINRVDQAIEDEKEKESFRKSSLESKDFVFTNGQLLTDQLIQQLKSD
jgi:hypothetical protein